ncbi:molybdenum cofactor biosynthesis protein A [Asticcacaulis biprosthecium C19]|uniref:GTP 3',8-cyclase n=1 Tax=Asticcacaulis biprosthecium C19 TaxID=715226 RepID=F4QLW6_9CAUL|nr:GTP 3',8-cyclase MoaA [Asticcacaulis biprosthecium]EGF92385.1 molybdenum cofactor biosynthesis protein A [Asticcacaulis biprosthecium C19]
MTSPAPLIDGFGRRLSYVRLSVTDRCDLRCTYCMSETQTFLPRKDLLSWEEMERLSRFLIQSGVDKLRITGGEPLVRKGVLDFIGRLGEEVHAGRLKELTLTTNGTLLEGAAPALAAAGVKRINVSCDSLRPEVFRRVTRGGDLAKVLTGIEAAQDHGIRIKLNVVALAQDNLADLPDIIAFAHERGMDVSLIETMPLGDIEGREAQFVSLGQVLETLRTYWKIEPTAETTAGPSRYYRVAETGGRLGLITPLSHNFCDTCNRVRITCTGQLYMCLGQDDHVDLRGPLRDDPSDAGLAQALQQALTHKPRAHDFFINSNALPPVERSHRPARTMSVTGG